LNGERVSGISRVLGQKLDKQPKAVAGQVAALGRLEGASTGAMLTPSGESAGEAWPPPLKPMFSLAVRAQQRSDEVKLTGAPRPARG
jgi:elongation factor G